VSPPQPAAVALPPPPEATVAEMADQIYLIVKAAKEEGCFDQLEV
jgi:hypothetical protein